MTLDNPGVGDENTNGDTGGTALTSEVMASSDLDNLAMLHGDNRSAIAPFTSFSPEIRESDSATTWDEEKQLNPSVQGKPIPSPSSKQSRSLSGSGRANSRGSDWVIEVFAEDGHRDRGRWLATLKVNPIFPSPVESRQNRSSPAVAVNGRITIELQLENCIQ